MIIFQGLKNRILRKEGGTHDGVDAEPHLGSVGPQAGVLPCWRGQPAMREPIRLAASGFPEGGGPPHLQWAIWWSACVDHHGPFDPADSSPSPAAQSPSSGQAINGLSLRVRLGSAYRIWKRLGAPRGTGILIRRGFSSLRAADDE